MKTDDLDYLVQCKKEKLKVASRRKRLEIWLQFQILRQWEKLQMCLFFVSKSTIQRTFRGQDCSKTRKESWLSKFSKRGGLTGSQLQEGGCWTRGDNFFQEGLQFLLKNKLKSELFNGKKSFSKKYFSAITKDSNWGILTKNLVTFKDIVRSFSMFH